MARYMKFGITASLDNLLNRISSRNGNDLRAQVCLYRSIATKETNHKS